MTGKVLVLGGNGRFGRSAAEAFWNAGWKVRLFDRDADTLPDAAMGAEVIVNGWNPPYDRWAAELPGLTDKVIEAARASGATLIQAQNIYVYGKGSPERLAVETPHAARNELGRLRIGMEERLRASGIRVILLRAGDFIDTAGSGNWLDRIILAKLGKGRLVYPGNPDIPHAWAYLPDLARAAVALAQRRDSLAPFEDVPYPGYTLSGRDLAALVSRAVGREIAVRPMSWLPLRVAAPFWPMARRLLEMRYLWDMPHRIDAARFDALVPGFTSTAPEEAVAAAVAGLGTEAARPRPAPTGGRTWSVAVL